MTVGELSEMALGWFIFGYGCLIWNALTHPIYSESSMTWGLWVGSWTIAMIILIRKESKHES